MSVRKLILEFYKSEAIINSAVLDSFLHPEAILEWNSLDGLKKMNRHEWIEYTKGLEKAYVRSKARISHVLVDKDLASVKYSLFAKIFENPREEMYLADFMAIWEIKDDKLYRCYQISRAV